METMSVRNKLYLLVAVSLVVMLALSGMALHGFQSDQEVFGQVGKMQMGKLEKLNHLRFDLIEVRRNIMAAYIEVIQGHDDNDSLNNAESAWKDLDETSSRYQSALSESEQSAWSQVQPLHAPTPQPILVSSETSRESPAFAQTCFTAFSIDTGPHA